jgi:hypothetical protein
MVFSRGWVYGFIEARRIRRLQREGEGEAADANGAAQSMRILKKAVQGCRVLQWGARFPKWPLGRRSPVP